MRKRTKTILSYTCCALILTGVMIWGCSCFMPKPDPLVGWKVMDIGREGEPVNEILKGDYQDFIEKIPPVGPKGFYISPIFVYEDMTGQHAVNFEYYKLNRDVWNYYLFYDKNNKRIKVIKYYLGHSSC